MSRPATPKAETPPPGSVSSVEQKLAQALTTIPEETPSYTYTGDLTDEELLADQKKIGEKIRETFPPEFCQLLARFSYYLSTVGLDFNEACLMVRFDPKDMTEKIKEYPIIQELIDVKELEYKVNLIKVVSQKAKKGDDKLAQWILERRFPQEFNPKKGTGTPEKQSADLMAMAVEFIQKSSDSNPLIKETSGRAFMIKKNSQEDIISAVNDVLK